MDNGKLKPAPPIRTDEDRLARVEQKVVDSNQDQLWREHHALRKWVSDLDRDITICKKHRESYLDSLTEVANAIMRLQRVVDRLERDVQDLMSRSDHPGQT